MQLDIPATTLLANEAQRLLKELPGYYSRPNHRIFLAKAGLKDAHVNGFLQLFARQDEALTTGQFAVVMVFYDQCRQLQADALPASVMEAVASPQAVHDGHGHSDVALAYRLLKPVEQMSLPELVEVTRFVGLLMSNLSRLGRSQEPLRSIPPRSPANSSAGAGVAAA